MARKGWRALGLAALAAGIGGAAVYAAYARDIADARARLRQECGIADTAAGPIEYVSRGEGLPVLSIHGAGGGCDQGLAIAESFLGTGFRIIAPSRFGYLRTPAPTDASPAAQADAHAALLDALGIDRAVVVGASAGAASALQMALRHPERVSALIVMVPATYAPGHEVSVDDSAGSRLVLRAVLAGADFAWWSAERVARPMLIRFLGVPPELAAAAPAAEQEQLKAWIDAVLPLSERLEGLRIDSTPNFERLPLETIAVPTLVVGARDDLFKTLPAAEFIADTVPGAKRVVFETGGHLMLGRQEELRRAVHTLLLDQRLVPA